MVLKIALLQIKPGSTMEEPFVRKDKRQKAD